MDQAQLMELPVEVAASRVNLKTLEWLFQPRSVFELFAASDPAGTQAKVDEWKVWAAANMEPALAKEYADEMERILKSQSFCRKVKALLCCGSPTPSSSSDSGASATSGGTPSCSVSPAKPCTPG